MASDPETRKMEMFMREARLKAAVEISKACIEFEGFDGPTKELISDCARLIHEEIKEGLSLFETTTTARPDLDMKPKVNDG